MARVFSRDSLRGVALISVAAIALHQLRYLLGYGAESQHALAEHGHSYLTGAIPEIAGVAAVLIVASLAAPMLRGRSGDLPRAGWLAWSVAVLTVYSAQEMTEGVLAAGHPSGLAALSAGSGWIAIPLAFAVGAIATCVWSWLERAENMIAATVARPVLPRAPKSTQRALPATNLRPSTPSLAFGYSQRPPPIAF